MRIPQLIIALLPALSLQSQVPTEKQPRRHKGPQHPLPLPGRGTAFESIPIPLERWYNHKAASKNGEVDFDYARRSFPADELPRGWIEHGGVNFSLPDWDNPEADHVVTDGQRIRIDPPVHAHAMHMLTAGDFFDGETGAVLKLHFNDGSTVQREVLVRNWWTLHWLNVGAIKTPYHFTGPSKRNYNISQIYPSSISLPSHARLTAITLPPNPNFNRLHLFALTLVPSLPHNHDTTPLHVRSVRATSNWTPYGDKRAQVLEVTLANLSRDRWAVGKREVGVVGKGVKTLEKGVIWRVMPGDEVRARVLVEPLEMGSQKVYVNVDRHGGMESPFVVELGLPTWEKDKELDKHETPEWWNGAKFGIFFHWGLYAVPAWTIPGVYGEWYWWNQHTNPAHKAHHLTTYGPKFVYNDFIPQFTALNFNASAWVDLILGAGAKYFILTSKHHDGFAIFDTHESSNRNSVKLGPQRDFVNELFEAAKDRGGLHRGVYFSMPEWFNPSYEPHAWERFPGMLPRNAYNSSELEPYTGYIPVGSYVHDLQRRQMEILADLGTEIMWCDIGGANDTRTFARKWFAQADKEGRQVTLNNRCGALPDFDTPEYASFASIQERRWETNEGIDTTPSYGYNKETPDYAYRNSTQIVHSLVDIVSKNGNYLLNVGPTADGTIIPLMTERLLEVGKWLENAGNCIYNTTFFYLGAEHGPWRFTRTPTSFCFILLEPPKHHIQQLRGRVRVELNRQVPVLPGDQVELLGAEPGAIEWEVSSSGGLELSVKLDEWAKAGRGHAWAFRAVYREVLDSQVV